MNEDPDKMVDDVEAAAKAQLVAEAADLKKEAMGQATTAGKNFIGGIFGGGKDSSDSDSDTDSKS